MDFDVGVRDELSAVTSVDVAFTALKGARAGALKFPCHFGRSRAPITEILNFSCFSIVDRNVQDTPQNAIVQQANWQTWLSQEPQPHCLHAYGGMFTGDVISSGKCLTTFHLTELTRPSFERSISTRALPSPRALLAPKPTVCISCMQSLAVC